MNRIIGTKEELAATLVKFEWIDDSIFAEFTYGNGGNNITINRLVETLHNEHYFPEDYPSKDIPNEETEINNISLHFLSRELFLVFTEPMLFGDFMDYLFYNLTFETIGFVEKEG